MSQGNEPSVLVGALGQENVASGDAFEAGLVESRPRLFRVARLLLDSREEAEDITQKVLLKALEGRSSFRGQAELYTWLYRILINQCKDLYKSRSRRAQRFTSEAMASEPAAPGPHGEAILAGREREAQVRNALSRLDPMWREILVLRHYEDLSYEQMARVLRVPIGTVRSRLSTARDRLRGELAREGI